MRRRTFLGLASMALLHGCGRDDAYGQLSDLPATHDETAPHTIRDLIRESGYYGRDANSIIGLVALDYDENFGPVNRPFRMALMIDPDDGEPITNFFEGIPVKPGEHPIVGEGNTWFRVPRLDSANIKYSKSVQLFADHFPDWLDRNFQLTFKEFKGHAYYLENVPKGLAFIWFQTGFDGNRVTQFPLAVRLDPNPKALTRLDLHIRRTHEELPFHTL